MKPPRHIDLFSGIGGFALAAHWAGYQTEVFCEQDEFCQQVLNRHWPTIPVVSDIRDFDGSAYAGADLLTGGFPCQPFSCAGKRQGEADNRFLWPEMLRIIREARPAWIVGENVAGIINMALDGVLSDLENEGYATQAFVIPACAVNAPHRRDRVWIVARRDDRYKPSPDEWSVDLSAPCWQECECCGEFICNIHQCHAWECDCPTIEEWGEFDPYSYSVGERLENLKQSRATTRATERSGDGDNSSRRPLITHLGERHDGLPEYMARYWDGDWERGIPRVATGIPQRAAKLKAMGNAIVPQVAYEIISRIPHD